MNIAESYTRTYLHRYVNTENYIQELASDIKLHYNRTKFHHINISDENFQNVYDSSEWQFRKISAIPIAIAKTLQVIITNLALPIIFMVIKWDYNVFIEGLYFQARTLESSLAHFTTLFNDYLGQRMLLQAKINKLMHISGHSIFSIYSELKAKLESGVLAYSEMLKDPKYKVFSNDKSLFTIATKNVLPDQFLENYKRAPLEIKNDSLIAEKAFQLSFDAYRWLPFKMRYDEKIAQKAYNHDVKNIRYASLAFQRKNGYDPVLFAHGDSSSLTGLSNGAFCLSKDNQNTNPSSYRFIIKLSFKNNLGEKLDIIRDYPIQIINDEIHLPFQNKSTEIPILKSFSEFKDYIYQVDFNSPKGPLFLKHSKDDFWVLPINDPYKVQPLDIIELFNKNIKTHKNGLYKFSKKYIPSLSSHYVYIKDNKFNIYTHIHGKTGILGSGGFHTFKKIIGDKNNLAIQYTKKPSINIPQHFINKYLNKLKKIPLPFNVPISTEKFSDTVIKTQVQISEAMTCNMKSFFKVINSYFSKKPNSELPHYLDILSRCYGGMAYSLKTLHEIGYAHGDIKPENFLVNDLMLTSNEWSIKKSGISLCDFDSVTRAEDNRISRFYTPSYYPSIPPSTLSKNLSSLSYKYTPIQLSKKLDIFALMISYIHGIEISGYQIERFPNEFQETFDEYKSIIDTCNNDSFKDSMLYILRLMNEIPDLSYILKRHEVHMQCLRKLEMKNLI